MLKTVRNLRVPWKTESFFDQPRETNSSTKLFFYGLLLDYQRNDHSFESRHGKDIFLFFKSSIPALGPNQLPI